MKSNNIKILFWLFKARLNKRNQAPLCLRITYNNKRKNFSTGFYVEPEKWDNVRYKVKSSQENASSINNYIHQTRARLMALFNEMLIDGDVNIDRLLEQLLGKNSSQRTILEAVNYHNDDFKQRIGIDYTMSTFEKYDILRKKLELFIPHRYNKKDIFLKDLSPSFATDFEFYLKSHDGNKHNTVVKYLTNLKKILNMAVLNGWIDKSPFKNVKAVFKDVHRELLTMPELQLIIDKSFKIERLAITKDLFLFQCFTGVAYSDMASLTKANLTTGIDGNTWIVLRRKKTDTRSAVPLLNIPLEILKKYDGKTQNDKLLPCYVIQRFNAYLQEIIDICGINKKLSSHAGRRTFATTVALANGLSIETISKILGHSSVKVTSIYAVVSDLKISEEMNKLKQLL